MFDERNIRRSIMLRAKNLFSSPPAGTFGTAFTVYGEDDVRAVMAGTLTPSRPCVFITDSNIRPVDIALPAVVVEVPTTWRRPFELGNRFGARTDAFFHVFGRMRGERDDLSTFLAKNLGAALAIYDFSSGSAVFSEWAVVEDTINISKVDLTRPDERTESSIDLWNAVEFFLLTKL